MRSIVLLGGGNVAFHLTRTLLKNKAFQLVQVYNRSITTINHLKGIVDITNQISDLKKADIYILAISDNSIADCSSYLQFKNSLVVHTSGSIGLDELKCTAHKGVLYPLQTFSKTKNISFNNIPICIEAESKEGLQLLEKLANSLSKKVFHIDSSQRKSLHLSAVFVNNFVNYLYHVGNEICTKNEIPFEILLPLIEETADKIKQLSPKAAQTGPAKREDTGTIHKHLSMLDGHHKDIYALLTESIKQITNKK